MKKVLAMMLVLASVMMLACSCFACEKKNEKEMTDAAVIDMIFDIFANEEVTEEGHEELRREAYSVVVRPMKMVFRREETKAEKISGYMINMDKSSRSLSFNKAEENTFRFSGRQFKSLEQINSVEYMLSFMMTDMQNAEIEKGEF